MSGVKDSLSLLAQSVVLTRDVQEMKDCIGMTEGLETSAFGPWATSLGLRVQYDAIHSLHDSFDCPIVDFFDDASVTDFDEASMNTRMRLETPME